MVALRPQFGDVEKQAAGDTVFVTSKAGGFFLASGPLRGLRRWRTARPASVRP